MASSSIGFKKRHFALPLFIFFAMAYSLPRSTTLLPLCVEQAKNYWG
jgi:hypothetical protein